MCVTYLSRDSCRNLICKNLGSALLRTGWWPWPVSRAVGAEAGARRRSGTRDRRGKRRNVFLQRGNCNMPVGCIARVRLIWTRDLD